MQIVTVNIVAVLLATLASFVIGGILHGTIFKGIPLGASKKKGMPKEAIPIALIGTFMTYYVLAHVLAFAETANWLEGLQGGFWMYLGFVLPLQIAVKYTNDLSWKTLGANTTCMLASLLAGGAIIGAW